LLGSMDLSLMIFCINLVLSNNWNLINKDNLN